LFLIFPRKLIPFLAGRIGNPNKKEIKNKKHKKVFVWIADRKSQKSRKPKQKTRKSKLKTPKPSFSFVVSSVGTRSNSTVFWTLDV
jgi:hypothetical protein